MDYESLDEAKFRDVVSGLSKKGWSLARVSGSHHIYKHPKSKETISVPRHTKDISPGVATQIQRKSQMVSEDGAMGAGAVGTTSDIPANNTDVSGVAGIAKNPPIKKKKIDLLKRPAPIGVPRKLRQIISKEK